MIEENGVRCSTKNSLEIKKLFKNADINDSILIKEYLGDNVFLIRKAYKPYNWKMYLDVLYKLCYSFKEFADELDNDLSGAKMNGFDISQIDLEKYNTTGMTSEYIATKEEPKKTINLSFEKNALQIDHILNLDSEEDNVLLKNEIENPSFAEIADRDRNDLNDYKSKNVPFYYISDLHLCHILQRKKANTYEKVVSAINEVVTNIINSYKKYRTEIHYFGREDKILFAGDISSNPQVFELFLCELRNQGLRNAIFILGNHEYWSFESVESSVKWHKSITEKYGYVCLHNEVLLYMDENHKTYNKVINEDLIMNSSNDELIRSIECARYIILGGTAFAGCNDKYNAQSGIYRNGLSNNLLTARSIEISESFRFEDIYNKLLDILKHRQVIVCTHNPVSDWTFEGYCPNWIYVNGHTHNNRRVINRNQRLYADNQVGYKGSNIQLKYFSAETRNNIFDHYKDGIYKISSIEYQDFMDGRNVSMTLSYRDDTYWLLKKSDYYLFMIFRQTGRGCPDAYICDGGRKKKIGNHDPEYYWDNMDKVISVLEGPTIKFNEVLAREAEYVRSFGGSGQIHGCIVDINFHCHLFVNINDFQITPYHAYDMCERTVYSDIGNLIKERCPELYDGFKRIEDGRNISAIAKVEKQNSLIQYSSGTELYKESNVIKRLDLLRTAKVLTQWLDNPDAIRNQGVNCIPVNSHIIESKELTAEKTIQINERENRSSESINKKSFINTLKRRILQKR